jgi:hypothetical protein
MDCLPINISGLLKYDKKWREMMGYRYPYVDSFKYHLTEKLPTSDIKCYERYPNYNWVYDKLFIAQSQGLMCGKLETLKTQKLAQVKFPIFIKPRWGHKSAFSVNCYKINKYEDLNDYFSLDQMIWSEFIDATEGMTDFMVLNGRIVHQITYNYSKKQNGFSDDWKYISYDNKPPSKVVEWVNLHMKGFTGVVNAQYRGDTIIEIGLRLARKGTYILSTQNKALIENINGLIEKGQWNHYNHDQMKFEPYYSFKCFVNCPIIYLFPEVIINKIVTKYDVKPFYEYYFEPVGKDGLVFFQFSHNDFNKGMELKKNMEFLFSYAQYSLLLLFVISFVVIFTNVKFGISLLVISFMLLLTRYLNPIFKNVSFYNKVIKR